MHAHTLTVSVYAKEASKSRLCRIFRVVFCFRLSVWFRCDWQLNSLKMRKKDMERRFIHPIFIIIIIMLVVNSVKIFLIHHSFMFAFRWWQRRPKPVHRTRRQQQWHRASNQMHSPIPLNRTQTVVMRLQSTCCIVGSNKMAAMFIGSKVIKHTHIQHTKLSLSLSRTHYIVCDRRGSNGSNGGNGQQTNNKRMSV